MRAHKLAAVRARIEVRRKGGRGEHGLAGAGWWAVKDHDGGAPVPHLVRVGASASPTAARRPASSAARPPDRSMPRSERFTLSPECGQIGIDTGGAAVPLGWSTARIGSETLSTFVGSVARSLSVPLHGSPRGACSGRSAVVLNGKLARQPAAAVAVAA